MKGTPVFCCVCLIQICMYVVLGTTDDFPGSHDEEEVHVYKKYARYPPYIYMYASPDDGEAKPDQFDLDEAGIISKLASIPHRRNNNNNNDNNVEHYHQHYTNDLEPELEAARERPASENYVRKKKSSVSWLLAAAIRMCQKHPLECLRQKEMQEHMDVKSMMENGR